MADEAPVVPAVETPSLGEILTSLGGPDPVTIEQMKKTFGQVFVTPLSDTEVFVWRPIKRMEFRELQKKLSDPATGWDQLDYEEALVKTCVLWSSGGQIDKGGTSTTLAEQIMQRSNFMSPGAAAQMVFQL